MPPKTAVLLVETTAINNRHDESTAPCVTGSGRVVPFLRPVVRLQAHHGSISGFYGEMDAVRDTHVVFSLHVSARRNRGRYEVGRFFGAVERLKRAAEEQNNREAQTAFAAMSVAYDRYLKVSTRRDACLTRQHLYSCDANYGIYRKSSRRTGEPNCTTGVSRIVSRACCLSSQGCACVSRIQCNGLRFFRGRIFTFLLPTCFRPVTCMTGTTR